LLDNTKYIIFILSIQLAEEQKMPGSSDEVLIKVTGHLNRMSLEMAVFWVVTPCSHVEFDRRFRSAAPEDGGSKHLWNVGKLLPDYTAQQPRRQPSSK
jgi:hypothetical protein